MAGRDNGLPPRESQLFKSIVKHYETKQYKKGLKAADSVLKKYAEHGETLSMKGLILNCLERKTEAYDLARLGVKKDIKSHVCWHVYGLLYRSDREYLQAIKCYQNALRHDPDNVQILRDLSLLQVQMRDLDGFVQTRQRLLSLKPTNRNNWFTFALARHLRGQPGAAKGIVEAYEKTLEGTPDNDYEHSEMILYKIMLVSEDGKPADALALLDSCESDIVDKLHCLELRAGFMRDLARWGEAASLYRQLLKRNPEHHAYHAGLQASILERPVAIERWLDKEVGAEAEAALKGLYEELQHHFPRSAVCRRIPLDFARDEAHFRVAAKTYILPPLRKGVPSLFADLKPLYTQPMKARVLGEILETWLEALQTKNGFLPGESAQEMPSTIMWVRSLLGQHYDMVGDTGRGLEQLDLAIEHAPSLLDLYMVKARVYKHSGGLVDASDWMDQARRMDLADRYLNTKATRYMLRANQLEDANKTIALFTKDGDQNSNLFDMQCMWYELEVARCHVRMGERGKALKNFSSIEKHFNDIIEDQFDFHTYCVRKMTLRAYINMLRLEDSIQGHHFYVDAACGMIETYIDLYDVPKTSASAVEEAAGDEMSAAERKKAESKRRKAEAKAKAEADAAKAKEAAEAKSSGGGGGGGNKSKSKTKEKPVDEDPDGAALAAAEDPLERASVYLRTLQRHAPKELRTHLLACELAMRKKKYLLVLRALRKAKELAPEDPRVHKAVLAFLHEVGTATLNPTIAKVIDDNRAAIGAPKGTSLEQLNQQFLLSAQQRGGTSGTAAILAAAEAQLLIDPSKRNAAMALVTAIDVKSLSLPLACALHALLKDKFKDLSAATAFGQKALGRFPFATYFGGKAPAPTPTPDTPMSKP